MPEETENQGTISKALGVWAKPYQFHVRLGGLPCTDIELVLEVEELIMREQTKAVS